MIIQFYVYNPVICYSQFINNYFVSLVTIKLTRDAAPLSPVTVKISNHTHVKPAFVSGVGVRNVKLTNSVRIEFKNINWTDFFV